MKRLLLTTGLICIAPVFSLGAHAQTAPPGETNEETSEKDPSSLTSSGVNQRTSLQSVYASESVVKVNTMYLKSSAASGIYAEQTAHINNAAIVNSDVDINRIAVHAGDFSSSVITQSTYINGADIQNTTLELNRVVLN